VGAGDPFYGATGWRSLPKRLTTEAHRWGKRQRHWTSSAGGVPEAQLHKLHRTKGVPRDLLNGERKL
jgi:hypothetical protein